MMYRGLWKFIKKYTDNSHAVSIFLPALIVLWTLAGVAAGMIICAAAGADMMTMLADVICAGGYAGLILGLFGGCYYLYRLGV